MKLADATPLIWLIVFVIVAIGKGLNKLRQPDQDDSSTDDDAPPVVRPPRPQIPRPQPQPRPVVPRMARPLSRAAPRMPPPPRTSTPTPRGRTVDADGIRRFVDQLSGKPQPLAPPPARKAEPPPAPPRQPEPVAQTSEAKQQIAAASMPAQTSRASQWMEALRDRNNIRNIIISAEIIGPPKAELV
jgi:hypothetical protein